MPPIRKFQREEIIDTAYEIVRKEGLNSINARRIAKELGGSVQPIYHNFKDMEELKEEVNRKIYKKYEEYMLSGINEKNGYKNTGLSFIRFSRDYPELFRILFMQESKATFKDFVLTDEVDDNVIKDTITTLGYEVENITEKKGLF